jgi:hypothetical protein
MKLILSVLSILFLSIQLFCQNTEGKIIELPNNDEITINLGKDIVDVNDMLEIWGDAETIHPATGQIVKSKNLILGKCKVIEVYSEKSKCIIVDRKYQIRNGDKVILLIRKESTSESLNIDENEIKPKSESGAVKITETNTLMDQVNIGESAINRKKEHLKLVKIIESDNTLIGILNKSPNGFKTKDVYLIDVNKQVVGFINYDSRFVDNAEGPIVVKKEFKENSEDIVNYGQLIKYKPLILTVGMHFYMYKGFESFSGFEDISNKMIGLNFGVDYYPNNSAEKLKKYNNWFWLGANIYVDKFLNTESYFDESNTKIEYKDKPLNFAFSFEAGFSFLGKSKLQEFKFWG